jgi:hypothetical protein
LKFDSALSSHNKYTPTLHAPVIGLGPKMAKNIGGQKNLIVNEVEQHAPRGGGAGFYLGFGVRVGLLDFCCSQCVLTVFPSNSCLVPKILPKFQTCSSIVFPIMDHFIAYLCHKLYSCININTPKSRRL